MIAALVHDELPDVHQFARELPHDVDAEQALVGHAEDQLDQALGKPEIRAFAFAPKDDRPVSWSRLEACAASSVSPTHATSGIEKT